MKTVLGCGNQDGWDTTGKSLKRSSTKTPRWQAVLAAAFTLDVYGHVIDQMKLESAQRMENYIKSVLDT